MVCEGELVWCVCVYVREREREGGCEEGGACVCRGVGGSGYAVKVYNSTGPRPPGNWDKESDFITCYRLNKLLQLINVAHTSS